MINHVLHVQHQIIENLIMEAAYALKNTEIMEKVIVKKYPVIIHVKVVKVKV